MTYENWRGPTRSRRTARPADHSPVVGIGGFASGPPDNIPEFRMMVSLQPSPLTRLSIAPSSANP
jgi:hypothetical protein